jgi:hypothetical protein
MSSVCSEFKMVAIQRWTMRVMHTVTGYRGVKARPSYVYDCDKRMKTDGFVCQRVKYEHRV